MKKLLIAMLATSSLVFGTGCGGDLCEDTQDTIEGLSDKLDDCPQLEQALEQALGEFDFDDDDVEECKEDIEDCSDSDVEKREEALDCINDLDKCEEGDEEAWATDFLECVEDLQAADCS
jgi:hypothetical protein